MALTQKALAEIVATARLTTGTVIGASGNIVTVPADTARIDYSDGQAALLVEAAATNLVPHSVATLGNWQSSGATLAQLSLAALGIFPGLAAASAGFDWNRASVNPALWISGQKYTASFWYKAGSSGKARCSCRDSTAGVESHASGPVGALAVVSGSAGAITNVVNTALGGGIYKCSYTFTANSSPAMCQLGIGPYSAVSGEDIVALGAQLEAGEAATSYIPTNGTTVTRAADICTVDVAALGLGAGFTLAVRGTITGAAGTSGIIANLDAGAYEDRQIIVLNSTGTGLGAQAFAGGVSQASTFTTYAPGDPFAAAMRVGPDRFRFVLNGAVGSDDLSVAFAPPKALRIGGSLASQVPARLRLKSLLLYRALLSDAALTTLGTV